jgi:hypothetical protein
VTDEQLRAELEAAMLPAGPIYDTALAVDELVRVTKRAAADELDRAIRENRTTVAKLGPMERLTCFLVKAEDLVCRAAELRSRP